MNVNVCQPLRAYSCTYDLTRTTEPKLGANYDRKLIGNAFSSSCSVFIFNLFACELNSSQVFSYFDYEMLNRNLFGGVYCFSSFISTKRSNVRSAR